MIKKISNPSTGQLSLLLLPLMVVCLITIVTMHIASWCLWTGILSVVAYYVAMAYFCIRQKCYKLLLISFAMGLTAVCFLYAIWRI